MQITHYTNYALRVLMYLTISKAPVRIVEIAEKHEISRHHLVKIVHQLGQRGYISTRQGRNGGIELNRPANSITIGEIFRVTEDRLSLLECLGEIDTKCKLKPVCRLKHAFEREHDAFVRELDSVTIADISANSEDILNLLNTPANETHAA